VVKIDTAFKDTYYASMLQTYVQTDDALNIQLVGKVLGRSGCIEPLKIENAHNISCCLRLGPRTIDNYGRPVNEEFWTFCSSDDRKTAPPLPNNTVKVEKMGVTFLFSINKDNDMLYLSSISYKVDIVPKVYLFIY
jgi:hypothetical protein